MSKELFDAQKELSDFLKQNPELLPEQVKINQLLREAKNQEERCLLINKLMLEKVQELKKEWKKLEDLLNVPS